jgi:hypothetical protein
MKYLLRDILRDAIEMAKETGIWQLLTLREKQEVVRYFLLHSDSLMDTVDCDRSENMATEHTMVEVVQC